MKRLYYLGTTSALILGLLLSACGSPGQQAKVPSQTQAPTSPTTPGAFGPSTTLTREQQLIEGAKKEGEVDLWSYSWAPGPVERAFEAKYPFLKLKAWNGSVQVQPRVTEEYKAGKHNVDVLVQPARRLIDLRDGGIIQEYAFPNVVNWPAQPSHNFWRYDLLSLRLPVYNTNLVSPADVPKSWDDVKSPKWAGKTIFSTSGADWPLSYAYLLGDVSSTDVKWDRTVSFWKDVVQNTKPRVANGWQIPLETLVMGGVSLMPMASLSVASQYIWKGAPLGYVPVSETTGSLNGMAMAKGPPHPYAAQLLIDFLTSPEGSALYADMMGSASLNPKANMTARENRDMIKAGVAWKPLPIELQHDDWILKASDLWMKTILGQK